MDRELELYRNIIFALFETHERPYNYANKRAKDTFHEMQKLQINPISDRMQLLRALPTEDDVDNSFPERDFLYLNPITNDQITVPVIWMTNDFSRSLPKISILLGLFTLVDNELRGLGYRFETPEGESTGKVGTHHYYHVQIIRKIRGIWFPPREYSAWMPESQPAFPLDCTNSIHLIIALLVTLYGRDKGLEPLLQQKKLAKELRLGNEQMMYHRFKTTMWHWMIRNRETKEEVYFYKSAREMSEYSDVARKYPGCDRVKILPSKYDRCNSNKKNELT